MVSDGLLPETLTRLAAHGAAQLEPVSRDAVLTTPSRVAVQTL